MLIHLIQKITDISLKDPVYDYYTGKEIGVVDSVLHDYNLIIVLVDGGYYWLYYSCGISLVAANDFKGIIWRFSDSTDIPRIKFKKG